MKTTQAPHLRLVDTSNFVPFMCRDNISLLEHFNYVNHIAERGGPKLPDYFPLIYSIEEIHRLTMSHLAIDEKLKLHDVFDPVRQPHFDVFATENTLFGRSFVKPYGYSGDFSLIQKIMNNSCSPFPQYNTWDRFFHWHDVAVGLRNAKVFLYDFLRKTRPQSICLLGSGSGDELWYAREAMSFDRITLFDSCLAARQEATRQFEGFEAVEVKRGTAAVADMELDHDLIWSLGLFNSLDDEIFVSTLRDIWNHNQRKSHIVIGNLVSGHSGQASMEVICQWFLHLRTSSDLKRLGRLAGIPEQAMSVSADQSGTILFLVCEKDH